MRRNVQTVTSLHNERSFVRLNKYSMRGIEFGPTLEGRCTFSPQFDDRPTIHLTNRQVRFLPSCYLRLRTFRNEYPGSFHNGHVRSVAVKNVEFCRIPGIGKLTDLN